MASKDWRRRPTSSKRFSRFILRDPSGFRGFTSSNWSPPTGGGKRRRSDLFPFRVAAGVASDFVHGERKMSNKRFIKEKKSFDNALGTKRGSHQVTSSVVLQLVGFLS